MYPAITLVDDTGISNSDNITNNRQIEIITPFSLKTGQSWFYSIDGGNNFITVPANTTRITVDLAYKTYEAGQIISYTKDANGKEGIIKSKKFVIDNIAPIFTAIDKTISMNAAQAQAGISIFGEDNISHSSDISIIKVVASGALIASNATLVIDTTNISMASDSTGTITINNVDYYYQFDSASKALLINKSDIRADFTSNELLTIQQLISFKTTNKTNGVRTFALSYTDRAGNENTTSKYTSNITGSNLSVTPIVNALSITTITDDTGIAGDYITNDDNGLIVKGTLTSALSANQNLTYSIDGGTTWLSNAVAAGTNFSATNTAID